MPPARRSPPHPPCPITGEPTCRLVHWVGSRFLTDLWRHAGGAEGGHLLRPAGRFGLWESPIGVIFFDPMAPGDEAVWAFHACIGAHEKLASPRMQRVESVAADRHVELGAGVIDVGCGHGESRAYVPGAPYTALDPSFVENPMGTVLAEGVAEHAAQAYDAVCAFPVIEHIADPLGFARVLADGLGPGDTHFVGTPF